MKYLRPFGIGVAAWLIAGSSAFAEVQLAIKDGKVSLVAKDATVKQILTEWSRVGQTKIVNIDKMTGGPVTLELLNTPEAQALDILLRSVAGYMAAPRPADVTNLSAFDRIVLMPTSTAPRGAASPSTPTFQQPQLAPQFAPPPPADDSDDERPAAPNPPVPGPQRGPIFNTVPPQGGNNPVTGAPQGFQPPGLPPQPPVVQQPPTAFPTAPFGGVAVPGMVAPATQPPNGRGGRQ